LRLGSYLRSYLNSSDYNVLRSTVIGLNNFIQYSRCATVSINAPLHESLYHNHT